MIEFPPYVLDRRAERLWRAGCVVALRPKTWAVLQYLAQRPGLLVSKEELVAAVWDQAAISDDAITRTIGELRRALEDDARTPRVIETVHRRGFRFIATLRAASAGPASSPETDSVDRPWLVGRDRELATLRAAFARASSGARQFVCVTGEPGAGKTALVSAFVQELRSSYPSVLVGWGQCLEQYGRRESYMPALEALERLVRRGADAVVSSLRALAPGWLAQIPSCQEARDAEVLARAATETPDRMLREFASLIEAWSVDVPVVLVFEDLHWSDVGTIDLLSVLAQRPERGRVLIVATFRRSEAAVSDHPIVPLVATLHTRRACIPLPLDGLTKADILEYLRVRLDSPRVAPEIAELVCTQTEGNPLFVTALVSDLLRRGRLAERDSQWVLTRERAAIDEDVPDDFVRVLESQLRLAEPSERHLLEVAGVAGEAFDAQLLAAGLEQSVEAVESGCERIRLVHGLFRYMGTHEWPDGAVGGRYVFVHAAYRRVLYDLLPPARRRALHQRLGERLEAGYAGATGAVASELTWHFQRSGDTRRALRYIADRARRSFEQRAYGDVIACVEAGLRLTHTLPRLPELAAWELDVRQPYGVALAYTSGYAADVVRTNLDRCLELADQLSDAGARLETLFALELLHSARGNWREAAEIGRQLRHLCEGSPSAHRAAYATGCHALWMGDHDTAAQLLEDARSARPADDERSARYGVSWRLGAASHDSLRLWLVGEDDRARVQQDDTIQTAEAHADPFTTTQTLTFGAIVQALSGRWTDAARLSERTLAIATDCGFTIFAGIALACLGRAMVGKGDTASGVRRMHEGSAMLQERGFRRTRSLLFTFQADACLKLGQRDEGLAAVEHGLAICDETAERALESELWRLQGELLLLRGRGGTRQRQENRQAARDCFMKACAIARRQGAHGLLHRAGESLWRMRPLKMEVEESAVPRPGVAGQPASSRSRSA